MTRSTTIGKRGFIWLPRTDATYWKIYINNVEVTVDIFTAEFTRAVCPEPGSFKIELINADSAYTNVFQQNQYVDLYIDFTGASTLQFRGRIDSLKNIYEQDRGYVLHVEGGHLTKNLYDTVVTEKYSGINSVQEILTLIIAKYNPLLTLSFTSTYTELPVINWDSKPFWDCISDLVDISSADCYLDEDLILYFFDKNTIENNNEAIVWNDTLVSTQGLGKQTVTTKNKIQVIGDDGTGLPVIATQQDLTSQAAYGVKEQVIFDSKASNEDYANTSALANLNISGTPVDEGDAESLILPSLRPGQKIWITNPPDQILDQYRVYSYTHKLPDERTMVTINKERQIKQVFKKQSDINLSNQALTNPFACIGSINYTFDDSTEIAAADANVTVTAGKVVLSSGTGGVFTTVAITTTTVVSSIQLRAVGNTLAPTTFEVSTDGGATYQTLILETLNALSGPGTNIILRVTIGDATTEIDSIALLYK